MAKRMKASDHWARGRFFTPGAPQPKGLADVLRWVAHRQKGEWLAWIDAQPGQPPRERVPGDALVVTLVNHTTFLLQTRGLNFLTDPVWSERVSPFSFIGPKRHRPPGLLFNDLPRIDCLLISHNHYDHLDLPTLRRLAARDSPPVFCPLGLEPLLRKAGLREIFELDWWESRSWKGLEIHCVPAQHFASRTPFDRNKTLWCGWVFGPDAQRIFFAGDTGLGPHFGEISRRLGPFRLAVLPIGAYAPEWFMGPIHMTPEQAVEALSSTGAACAVASHYGTFALADDGYAEPVERLRAAMADRPEGAPPFLVLEEGAACEIALADLVPLVVRG